MPSRDNSEMLKNRNLFLILKAIREHGPISRVEIARSLNLHPSTVSRLVGELIGMNLVLEGAEQGTSTERGGRPSIALELNASAGYLIGVDVGGTTMMGSLADLSGKVILRRSRPSKPAPDADGEQSLRQLIEMAQELIQAAPDPKLIWGIGIGVPATTLSEKGVVVWAPALGWRNLPIKQIVERALNLPVFVENDVNLAALGEHQSGAGQGVDDLVVIFIGTGIGAGVILNGQLYRGANQAAGEVGYMVVDTESLSRRYDQFGCLESLASGPGIAARARQRIKAGEETALLDLAGGNPTQITAETVFEAARRGDPLATQVVDQTIKYLGLAIVNIASLLNPAMVVIGGGVARSADLLLESIRQQVDGVVPNVPRLAVSVLGKEAVIKGAFALVLRQISEIAWRIP